MSWLGQDVDFDLSKLVEASVRVIGQNGGKCDLARSLDALLELLLVIVFGNVDLLNSGQTKQLLVRDDKVPAVSLEEGIVLRVNVARLLSGLQVQVVDSELAGEHVADADLVFAFDLGSHGELDEGQGVDALLLLLELRLELC